MPKSFQWADYWDSDTRYGRISETAEKVGTESGGPTTLQIVVAIILIISGLFIIVGIIKLSEKNKRKQSR